MSDITEGVRQVIESIMRAKGGCTTEDLLDAARDPDSPAHAGFEWDDAKAGEEYRKDQARRHLRIAFVSVNNKPPERTVFCPSPRDEKTDTPGARPGIYRPLSMMIQRPDEWARTVAASVQRVESAQRALQELCDYSITHNDAAEHHPAIKRASGFLFSAYELLDKLRRPGERHPARA